MSEVVLIIRSPIQLLLVPAFVVVFLWLIAPIDFVMSGDVLTVVLALLMPAMLSLGCLVGFRRFSSVSTPIQLKPVRVRRALYLVSFLGFLGLVLRLFERIVLRSAEGLTLDFMANRTMLESGGNALISFVSGVLVTSLLLLPFFYLLLRKVGKTNWLQKALVYASLLYPVSDVVLQGSRSTLVVYFGVVFISWVVLNRLRFRFRFIVFISLLIVGLAWLLGTVFYVRTAQMGLDPIASMHLSGYAKFAPASESVIKYLAQNELSVIDMLVYAYVHILQYLLHGVYEFFYILSEFSGATTYGLQSFYIPMKLIFSITGSQDLESLLGEAVLREGVFITMFGPLVYDYGIFGGGLSCLLLGFAFGVLGRKLKHGSVSLLPLYLVIMSFLPFAFVLSLFVSGSGQYALLNSAFVSSLLMTRWFRLV